MKNKILILSMIFMLFSFIFINNIVFATESTPNTLILNILIDSINNDIDYSTGNYDLLICSTNTGYVAYILTKPEGFNYWTNNGRDTFGAVNSIPQDVPFNCKHINFDASGNITNTGTFLSVTYVKANTANILYSTFDMYGDKGCTEIFFQRAPVMEQEKTLGVVAQKMETVEMNPLKEILILVPIMIILLTSYLGLRKGLVFIKMLRKM